jgi:hypothetical protein
VTRRWHAVRVHWPDGRTHDDQIRGHTAGEAIAAATANWITENPHGRADRIEYLSRPAELGDRDPAGGETTR